MPKTTATKRATREPDAESIAIEAALKRSAHTQGSLAASVGVTQGCVWQWVHGRRAIPASKAPDVAIELEVDPRDISADYRSVVAPRSGPQTSDRARSTGDARLDRAIVDLLKAARNSNHDAVRAAVALLKHTRPYVTGRMGSKGRG